MSLFLKTNIYTNVFMEVWDLKIKDITQNLISLMAMSRTPCLTIMEYGNDMFNGCVP